MSRDAAAALSPGQQRKRCTGRPGFEQHFLKKKFYLFSIIVCYSYNKELFFAENVRKEVGSATYLSVNVEKRGGVGYLPVR